MKKGVFFLSFAVLISVAIISCRKNNVDQKNVQPADVQTTMQAEAIAQARTYFENNVEKKLIINGGNIRQALNKKPLWDRANTIKLIDGQTGVIVPLEFNKPFTLKTESGSESLKLRQTSHLLIRIGENKTATVVTTIPGAFLKNNKLNLQEVTIVEDWAGNVLNKTAIKDGRVYQFVDKGTPIKTNGLRLNSNQCLYIVWELCDYINGATYNCEYYGTETIGCDQSLQPVDDSGSCEMVDPEGGAHTTAVNMSGSSSDIDGFHKNRVMVWKCIQSNTWYLNSTEVGQVKLVDVNENIWNWESFSHSSTTFNGSTSGGTSTVSNVTPEGNYTPGTENVRYATMKLYVTITYTSYAYQCLMQQGGINGAIASALFPPKSKTYEPHNVWDARP